MHHTITKREAKCNLLILLFSCLCLFLGIEDSHSEEVTVTHIHTDAAGNPVAATDEEGNLVWKENYQAFGARNLQQADSAQQSQWFHGKEQDAATGLQYFGARYYDPQIGRFLGVDPVDFQDKNLHSFNRYAYGNNNPVRYIDPDGEFPLPLLILLGWTAGGGAINGTINAATQQLMNGHIQWHGIGGVWDAVSDGVIMGPVLGAAARAGSGVAAARNSATAASVRENILITFGRGGNQSYHAFRHIDKKGLERSAVMDAIKKDLMPHVGDLKIGERFSGSVFVDGIKLDYNARRIFDGSVNVGRITPPR